MPSLRRLALLIVLAAPLAQAQDTPQRPIGPTRISGGVMAGLILTHPNPIYPQSAKDQHISGSVVLHAIIATDGTIERLEVVSGPEILRTASLEAVRQWVYKPYTLNGRPTEVDTTIIVNFTMSPPKAAITQPEL